MVPGSRAGGQTNGEVTSAEDEAVDFRRVVDSITDYAIFLLDPDGIIRSWSPGAERIKGWTADEVIGRHFSIFYVDAEIAGNRPALLLEAARQNSHVEDEGWRLRRDGSSFWAHVTITALKDADETIIGFAKITRDLTERKQREQSAQRLVLLEQHEAIGREVLGKTVSSLFAVGLNLQGVMLEAADQRIQRQIENAVNDLDTVISELRRALYSRMSAL